MITEPTDINILKLTINKLTQENKQLLESNKKLKIQECKLRDFIYDYTYMLGNQIQHILGFSKLLSEQFGSYESSKVLTSNQYRSDTISISSFFKTQIPNRAIET